MTSLNLLTAIAMLAEEINHHPDVKLGWGYLDITLITHDERKITSKDYLLADRIDKLITEWDGVQ
jgi:4a-hydroxytetrahydrobiopterin dehydratase